MITRRTFLSLPALVPLATWHGGPFDEHHFAYDHVIGTSLDLVVWTPSSGAAERARIAVLDEVHRLSSILDTRDPQSEISRLDEGAIGSPELNEVLAAYADWTERTAGVVSVRPRGANTPRNVDALGKAYIIERAATSAAAADPRIRAVLVNIGGDIVVRGRSCDIAVADPDAAHDNAPPLTRVRLDSLAIATSGTYARGAHLFDARTGRPAALARSATVAAADAVTANALATMLCLTDVGAGFELVGRTAGAEALRVASDGTIVRTSGFSQAEPQQTIRKTAVAGWPPGYGLTLALTLTDGASSFRNGGGFGGGGFGGRRRDSPRRPYVAVWVETPAGKLVRVLALWASKAKYYSELSSFWNISGRDRDLLYATARATREPGNYQLAWDGLDQDHRPVQTGSYRVVVETNREHGVYAKQSGTIVCGGTVPASLTLSATANFQAVSVQYGAKPTRA